MCSPVIEEGLVSGFVCRWIPRMAPIPDVVQGAGGGWTPLSWASWLCKSPGAPFSPVLWTRKLGAVGCEAIS